MIACCCCGLGQGRDRFDNHPGIPRLAVALSLKLFLQGACGCFYLPVRHGRCRSNNSLGEAFRGCGASCRRQNRQETFRILVENTKLLQVRYKQRINLLKL